MAMALPTGGPSRVRDDESVIFEVLADAGYGIAVTDAQGRFLSANRALCELYGYTEAELKALPSFFEVVLPAERAALGVRFLESLERAAGEPSSGEVTVVRGDGATIVIAYAVRAVGDGDERRWYSVIRDVTDARLAQRALADRAEQLERSNRDLEQFAYAASHDLQEPLRVTKGFLDLLQSRYGSKLDGDAREFVQFAAEGTARMQRLVADLLEYARSGAGAREPRATQADEALDEALANLSLAVKEAKATVERGPLPQVLADPVQLAQVFQNLLSNAVKFRGPEPPMVSVGAQRDGNFWRFSVQDNGIGIDPRDAARLFIIFQRPHGESYPGTGIGLALCKRIVERHGGRIWFGSEPGKGSTFHFTLPGVEA